MKNFKIELQLAKLNGKESQLYDKLTLKFIRQRYSLSQELALNRQQSKKPEQWQEFDDYCEERKSRARLLVYGE